MSQWGRVVVPNLDLKWAFFAMLHLLRFLHLGGPEQSLKSLGSAVGFSFVFELSSNEESKKCCWFQLCV